MHTTFSTQNDILNERYVYGAELTGRFDFPQLMEAHANVEGLRAVSFNLAGKEKDPKRCVAHFFCDDYRFRAIWTQPEKYIPMLKNFRYVCTPDFSAYGDAPLALQIYQRYRSRAMAYYLWLNDINVIPTAGWGDESTWDYCFDGLPMHSTLAVSTNGCFSKEGKECYRKGFAEMCRRLEPDRVVVVGSEIEVDCNVEIQYLQSYGQDMTRRIGGNGRTVRIEKKTQEKV